VCREHNWCVVPPQGADEAREEKAVVQVDDIWLQCAKEASQAKGCDWRYAALEAEDRGEIQCPRRVDGNPFMCRQIGRVLATPTQREYSHGDAAVGKSFRQRLDDCLHTAPALREVIGTEEDR
jgi:hypothetical protein